MPGNPHRIAPLVAVAAMAVLMLAAVLGMALGARIATSHGAGLSVAGSSSPSTVCGQTKVTLGAAANFRILAGTTITNTGSSKVKGNIGVSPGSAVTGFPPGTVTGTIHKADTAAANGEFALKTAYKNAMGRTNCPVSVAGNIGGQTLGPGLYKSTSSLSISSGDLTLTAHGHSGAVFIFQITSKLVVTSGRHVILAGGAQASHIYWAVGSSATIGTTAVVYGNILAHKSISLATGAVLHGRALAHIGAVTLAGSTLSHVPFSVSSAPMPSRALNAAMVVP
jgi:ice-binding like protein